MIQGGGPRTHIQKSHAARGWSCRRKKVLTWKSCPKLAEVPLGREVLGAGVRGKSEMCGVWVCLVCAVHVSVCVYSVYLCGVYIYEVCNCGMFV